MISKEKFCEIIQHIGLLQEQSQRINNILYDPMYHTVQNDFCSAYAFSNPCLEEDLIVVLENMFNDFENNWIRYYIYELDCGTSWQKGMVLDKNGNDIPLSNASELYNFIVYNDMVDFVGGITD